MLSIIILTHGQVHLTKECLESIIQHTVGEYELILVDNNSPDNTLEYLNNIKKQLEGKRTVHVLHNKENKGFSGGVNPALQISSGEYIALVNNDIVVTPGWNRKLSNALINNKGLGIVVAATNLCGNDAMVKHARYKTMKEMQIFASEWAEENEGRLLKLPMVGFYCIMFSRKLYQEIGELDERFYPGYFEDDDYCIRTRLAGYFCGAAMDCFVHHNHQGTFRTMNGVGSIVLKNKRVFEEKWGVTATLGDGSYKYIDTILERENKK